MRTAATVALLPLLRSRAQGEMLALLYLHPEQQYSLTDIARLTAVTVKTVHQEANRLVAAGLLSEQRIGNSRMLRAVTDSLLTRPLTDLLAVTYGPLPVLTHVLQEIPGVDRAFIYGSWAARYQGDPGPPPSDIDVLVVGDVNADDLDEAIAPAQATLRRQVNVRQLSTTSWESQTTDPFIKSVRSRPLVALPLEGVA